MTRHALLSARGTGGIIGQDLTSQVAQAAADLYDEVPVPTPATMGGIPVGAATDWRAPSGQECIDQAYEWMCRWVEANPTRTFAICGYSLLAIAATRVRAALEPGGRLARFRGNYVCGATFGDPSRPAGHTYYLGPDPGGEGISNWHMPEACATYDWCFLAHPDDLYTNVPRGQVGQICRDAYGMVVNTEVADPIATAMRVPPYILQLLDDSGIQLPPNIPGIIAGGFAGLLAGLIPALVPMAGDNETAAAAQAAILGLRFAAAGTGPHIQYHVNEVWPGQTYLGLAVQHVRDWGARRAAVA